MTYFNKATEKVEDLIPLIDKWGGPETFPHMASGSTVAFDVSFSWTKQVASSFGGSRRGMVIHWPKGIEERSSKIGRSERHCAEFLDVAFTKGRQILQTQTDFSEEEE